MASTRRLFYANNLRRGIAVARAVPGSYASLGGVSSFARADAATCATYRDVNKVLQTVAANVLRDAHYVGTWRTILLEPSRTNIVVQANDLTQSWTAVSAATAVKDRTGPDGVAASASTATVGVGQTAGGFLQNLGGGACSAATKQSYYAIIQAGTSPFVSLQDINDAVLHRCWINLSTLVAGTQQNCAITEIIPMTGGWYLVRFTFTTTNSYQLSFRSMACDTDNSQAATAGRTYGIAAIGVEKDQSFPTTPIITGAASVTRAVDALTLAGVPITGTLFYHYFDLATAAWTDAIAPYTASTAITPATGRAYHTMAVIAGTRTAAQCKAILGGTFP